MKFLLLVFLLSATGCSTPEGTSFSNYRAESTMLSTDCLYDFVLIDVYNESKGVCEKICMPSSALLELLQYEFNVRGEVCLKKVIAQKGSPFVFKKKKSLNLLSKYTLSDDDFSDLLKIESQFRGMSAIKIRETAADLSSRFGYQYKANVVAHAVLDKGLRCRISCANGAIIVY